MNKRTTGTVILITYIAILIKVMVVKDMPLIRIGPLMLNFGGSHEGPANLLPFKTILSYLFGEKGLIIALINLVGNIVLLVPIGFLVPFVYRNMTLKKSLVLAVTAGVTIEMMQVVSRVGIFDIDDIILNALGVIIGYWTFTILAEWMRSKKYKNIVFAAIMVIAATAAVFYAIYPKERQSLNPGNSADVAHSDRIHDEEGEDSQDGDLCGGTGGTGQIVSVGNTTITIRRNDDMIQTIKFTGRTTIRTSAGPVPKSELKMGDRVTLIIDESETASVVLICNLSQDKTPSEK